MAAVVMSERDGDSVKLTTRACMGCGEQHTVTVPWAGYERWLEGAYAQAAFPGLSSGDRELLISGICSPCWDRMFKE